jgi:phosphatidylinositol-3-phosphatase
VVPRAAPEEVLMKLLGVMVAVALFVQGASASAAVPQFGHVFLIVGENTSYSQITAKRAPYLTRTLRPEGAWLANYRTFTKSSSLGQYIALVSGQFTRCEANNALPAHCQQAVPNLFGQLAASGRTWRDWQESMPAACYRHDAGTPARHNEYGAHHNPALYFTNLAPSCPANNIPMGGTGAKATSAFDSALATGSVADFNLVVPNDCENGHDRCGGDPVGHFDAFLQREVPRIEASPAFGSNGVIFITWDEGADPPFDPGHVATLVLGPLVRRGVVDRTRHDHYGLERTLAAGFSTKPLAHAKRATAITTIWR